jgi:hypothetical protein
MVANDKRSSLFCRSDNDEAFLRQFILFRIRFRFQMRSNVHAGVKLNATVIGSETLLDTGR